MLSSILMCYKPEIGMISDTKRIDHGKWLSKTVLSLTCDAVSSISNRTGSSSTTVCCLYENSKNTMKYIPILPEAFLLLQAKFDGPSLSGNVCIWSLHDMAESKVELKGRGQILGSKVEVKGQFPGQMFAQYQSIESRTKSWLFWDWTRTK